MEELYVPTAQEWRGWLTDHHAESDGVWLVFYKKHTDVPSVAYADALSEAVCFGWIDSLIKRIDDQRYKRKFTPRKPHSNWSEANKRLVAQLIDEGRMAPAGLAAVEAAKESGEWFREEKEPTMPDELAAALDSDSQARDAFDSLPPSHRKRYLLWIGDAKRVETRRRRSEQAIEMLRRGERLGI